MPEQGFQDVAETLRERWDVPALAVGVSLGGRRERLALGCDPDARFRIASVTKPVTAALVLATLDLDAPVGVWPGVTARHLLSHTSGYDCELGDLRRFGDGDDALPRVVAELGGVRRWTDPGRVWSYSNAGYWLAGRLAAGAAGTSFEEALLERVCAAAGLEATGFDEPQLDGFDVDARSGALVRNEEGPYPRARRPSGGLVAPVDDLLRLGEWLLAGEVGEALRVPVARRPGGEYGLGLMLDRVDGHEVWHHGGDYGGFQSLLALVPARGLVFGGLTNSRTGGQVLRRLLDETLERSLGVRREPPARASRPAVELEPLAGRYEAPDTRVEVRVAGDGLEVAADGAVVRARPLVGGEFEVLDGASAGSRFDFPLPGFARFSSRLVEKVG
ncbi:MAG TPA: serine hydrolase domain-containing protein [Gaiellaceae bacterium]